MPVSKYMQVIKPINGINEYFFIKEKIARAIALNQKIINDKLGVATSIKLFLPET